ncbi:hypothetical protein EYZ11_005703 [Aspergillus tanneri]|uniref:Probable vacuolar protein sorting-associated protein 16 homolog n=1 Tax=Aspergillus tanneri TaxID=1220188 RepID=A0A4S3JNA3_9EURO|nr:hypothetical protein EYZ11_005703 [Aspergillus tanneri]
MAPSNPLANWEKLGDSFYRKVPIYDAVFDDDVQLENYIVVGAPYGGAIGMQQTTYSKASLYRDESKLFRFRDAQTNKSNIDIYSCSGKHINRIHWEYGTIRGLGWSDREELLVVTEDGMGAEEYGVRACRFWTSGFHHAPKEKYPHDPTESEDKVLQNGPFKHASVSPTGKFVALITAEGKVWVVSSDFQSKYSEYDPESRVTPRTVEWCGDDAVVIAWEDELHLIGPSGVAARYYYDDTVHVMPEFDGVRLITNETCEFLHKVTVLLDSVDLLEKKSPKADENIQRIRSSLPEAVDICVKAAGHEFHSHWQKRLLKAASFGKSVLDLYNSDEFVEMTERLRVLNAVRDYQIGLPISYEQYIRLTPEKLIERLVNRHEYLLAIRVSEYLQHPANKIYVHWASQKVKVSTVDDEAVCKLIVQRLEGKPGISFELIAQAAYDEGRAHLATQLLNHEPRAGKQVPLLLNMEEDEIALEKAIESGDNDLVNYVLLHLKSKLPLASFFRMINSRPMASALVEATARLEDTELLKDLYYQDDRPIDGSNVLLSEALNETELSRKTGKIHLASRLLADSKDASVVLQQKLLSEASQLLKVQESLDKDLTDRSEFLGLSLNQTIYRLIRSGYGKRAQKLQSEFKMSEKTYWWLRLRALVAKRDWGELEEIGKSKKSPIGWEILGAGNTKLASLFVPKCTNLSAEDKVEMWVKCGMIVKAGEEAFRAKDFNTLEVLRGRASGPAATEIERMINQLRPRK